MAANIQQAASLSVIQDAGALADILESLRVEHVPYSYQVPLTGFSIAWPRGASLLTLNPAGTLATGTITLPANPRDGRKITLVSTQIQTALTMSVVTGQTLVGGATALAANTPLSWVYNAPLATWFPAA